MDAHLANAKQVVSWLVEDQRIAYVNYAGLEDHLAPRAREASAVGCRFRVLLRVKGTEKASGRLVGGEFIDALQLASHLANIGDSRTSKVAPVRPRTSSCREQFEAAGVGGDLIRILRWA